MHGKNPTAALESFEKDSVLKIVIKNSIPTLIAMVMVMVYNLADTFFLGLTHDDLQVTAVSYASPLFMIFLSLGTLFGVGGTSLISRALGAGRVEYAKKVSAFCMWACIGVGALLMAVLWIFVEDVAVMLGATGESLALTKSYLEIVVGCGIFSMVSNCFSAIVRTEGEAMKAMTGSVVGNVLNLILDPLFILVFKWGVVGAAVATVIGNAVAAGYYVLYFLRGKSVLSISPKHVACGDGILSGVLSVGLSAFLTNFLVSMCAIVVNARLSGYPSGELLVAGYGVTSKVLMLTILGGIGVASGVQPFLGYSYGARDKKRLLSGIRVSVLLSTCLCVVVSILCFLFAEPIVRIFLTEDASVEAGARFIRILMSTTWLIGVFCVFQTTLQATGAATGSLLSAVFRQGILFIPAAFLLEAAIGMDGLLWAQPVADVLTLVILFFLLRHKINSTDFTAPVEAEE